MGSDRVPAYKLLPIRECQSMANHNVSDMIISRSRDWKQVRKHVEVQGTRSGTGTGTLSRK